MIRRLFALLLALIPLSACALSHPGGGTNADKNPVLRRSNSFKPQYPRPLAMVGVQGLITIDFAVNRDGTVNLDSTRILNTSNRIFTDSLRPFLSQLQFVPARVAGTASSGRTTVAFRYTLTDCAQYHGSPIISWALDSTPASIQIEGCVGPPPLTSEQVSAIVRERAVRSPSTGLDSVAAKLGLAPLFNRRDARDTTEIRYWLGGGLTEDRLVRLVKVGKEVTGSVAVYWRRSRFYPPSGAAGDQRMSAVDARWCRSASPLADNIGGCWITLATPPDWRRTWDSLQTLGVMTLRDQVVVPHKQRIVNDGYGFTIETRNGRNYRWYTYSNPNLFDDSEHRRATAIGRLLGRILEN